MATSSFLYNSARDSVVCLDTEAKKLSHKDFAQVYQSPHMFRPLFAIFAGDEVRLSVAPGDIPLLFDASGNILSDGDYSSLTSQSIGQRGFALKAGDRYLTAENSGALTVTSERASDSETFAEMTTRQMFLRLGSFVSSEASKNFKSGRLTALQTCDLYGRNAEIVHNVRVCATDWTTLRSGGRMLRPEITHLRRMHRGVYKTIFVGLRPTAGQPVASACLIGGYYNFFHHLLDYTLNYFSVAPFLSRELPLIIPRAVLPFQKDALSLFGLDRHPLIELDPLSVIKVKDLIIPKKAIVGDGNINDIDAFNSCRAHLLRLRGETRRPRRLFISRRRAAVRRAVNEAEAIALASKYGFVDVVLEDMSLADQIDHFLHAEAVTGLHGAGFTHLAYAPKDCGVVEIMHPEGWRPNSLQNVSKGLGHRFHRVSTLGGGHGSTDLVIDLDAFERGLQAIV